MARAPAAGRRSTRRAPASSPPARPPPSPSRPPRPSSSGATPIVHPLTGPVAIQGAEPGDLLVVHIVDIIQDDFAYTINVPGFGFLRSEVPGPAILHWDIKGDVATSRDLPGVRIHAEPSMGTTGIALSVAKTEEVYQREHELAGRGGVRLGPPANHPGPGRPCGDGGGLARRSCS